MSRPTGVYSSSAVHDLVVGFLGPVEDVGVAVHGLEEEFDALDGGHEGFGKGADETAEEEVGEGGGWVVRETLWRSWKGERG